MAWRRGRRGKRRPFASPEDVQGSLNKLQRMQELLAAGKSPNDAAQSLTAAGFRVTRQDMDMLRRLIQPWQSRAYAYYDLLGEIKYAAQFYSRALAQVELFVGETQKDSEGKAEIVPTSQTKVVEAFERISDPGGGRAQLQAQYGRLMFLAGECFMFVSADEDNEGEEKWEMLSTDELRVQSGTIMRYKAPSLYALDYHLPQNDDDWETVQDSVAMAYRLWQRHPRYSALADSTMMGVLDLCEELIILTRAVRARGRSRLAGNGILAIDERLSGDAPKEPVGDEDPAEDPFLDLLTEAMTTPISDEGSASAVVPIVVRCHVPEGLSMRDMIVHVPINDPTQLYPETGLREECIRRIAIGLDMPPEVLLGVMDANHWSAWLIDEQTWKHHLQPKVQQLCDDLSSAYLRPALRQAGVTDWQKYVVHYDATAVINHPDRFKDAQQAYKDRIIGKTAYRAAGGFDESDAPDKDELAEMIGVAIRDGSLAWYGIPSVKAGGVETQPGEVVSAEGTTEVPDDTAESGADVEPGIPATEPGGTDEVTRTASLSAHRVVAAVDLGMLRARELAGSRIRTQARSKHPQAFEDIDGVRNGDVAATLGRDRVVAMGLRERELVKGGSNLVEDSLRLWGLRDDSVAELIASNVEEHAARTLFMSPPPPLPSSFTNHLRSLASKG